MRKSGLELLRILAMGMIVVYHFLKWCYQPGCFNLWFNGDETVAEAILGAGGSWGVDLFLLISTWFLVDMEFSWKRPLRLYFTMILYTIPLTVVPLLLGFDASMKNILRGFFPFFGRALWFISAYLSLLVLTPFLKNVFRLPRGQLTKLMVILTILVAGVCSLPDIQDCYFCNFIWFVYVYLWMGWFKRSSLAAWLFAHRIFCLLMGLLLYVSLALIAHFKLPGNALAAQYLYDPKAIPNFVSALLVFVFFLQLKIGEIPFINHIAKASLAVYIVHQVPVFFPFLMTRLLHLEAGCGHVSLIRICLSAMILYGIVWAIDSLRDRLFRIRH